MVWGLRFLVCGSWFGVNGLGLYGPILGLCWPMLAHLGAMLAHLGLESVRQEQNVEPTDDDREGVSKWSSHGTKSHNLHISSAIPKHWRCTRKGIESEMVGS